MEYTYASLGKWPKKTFTMPSGWQFACDYKSHEISMKSTGVPLTGESAGRQIWYKKRDDKGTYFNSPSSPRSRAKSPFKEELTFCAADNPNSSDKIFRNLMISQWQGEVPDEDFTPKTARDAAAKGLGFYQMLQCEDGHWAGDYGGPMFLMPGLIIAMYVCKIPIAPERREGMVQYLLNHQQVDGGWGTHIECASTMFGTVLSYVSLRLLGESEKSPQVVKALEFIHFYGGALYAPSWAKFWLAALGVYDWKGVNPIPSEMWLLPKWFPFHPGNLWCHCRMVYLPMGYVYCSRFTPDVSKDTLLQSLRKELYLENYDTINFDLYRQKCADIDEYSPLNPFMKVAQDICCLYELILPHVPLLQNLRKQAQAFALEYIYAEDLQTNSIDIGPVNKALNMLSVYIGGTKHPPDKWL